VIFRIGTEVKRRKGEKGKKEKRNNELLGLIIRVSFFNYEL